MVRLLKSCAISFVVLISGLTLASCGSQNHFATRAEYKACDQLGFTYWLSATKIPSMSPSERAAFNWKILDASISILAMTARKSGNPNLVSFAKKLPKDFEVGSQGGAANAFADAMLGMAKECGALEWQGENPGPLLDGK